MKVLWTVQLLVIIVAHGAIKQVVSLQNPVESLPVAQLGARGFDLVRIPCRIEPALRRRAPTSDQPPPCKCRKSESEAKLGMIADLRELVTLVRLKRSTQTFLGLGLAHRAINCHLHRRIFRRGKSIIRETP